MSEEAKANDRLRSILKEMGATDEEPPKEEPPKAAQPGKQTGYIANIGAGLNEALASALGFPVDVMTGILNLLPAGVNAALGTNLPTIQNPVGGTESIKRALGVVGANPEDVAAGGAGEQWARSFAGGAGGAVIPGALAKAGLMRAAPMVPGAVASLGRHIAEGLATGASAGGAIAGGAGGVVGHSAASVVPREYAPLVDVLGNIVGGWIAGAGIEGVKAAARPVARTLSEATGLMGRGGQAPIVNPDTGEAFLHNLTGQPLTATETQAAMAGRRIAEAAGKSPEELAAAIPEKPGAIEGSTPTVGQATGNLGLLNRERQLRTLAGEGGQAPGRAAFTQAEAQNNEARLKALRGEMGEEARRDAAATFARDRMAELDRLNTALDDRLDELARGKAAGLGGGEGSDQAQGQRMREALEALRKPIKEALGRLYKAADPDGTMALQAGTIRDEARAVMKEVDPRFGGEWGPEEVQIKAAANLPDVVLFQDLLGLKSALSNKLRGIIKDQSLGAESQAARRATKVLGAIDNAIAEAAGRAAERGGAVGDGLAAEAARAGGEAVAAPGAAAVVVTPSGKRVPVQYRVVEADDLVASHTDAGRANPAFPAELQPRARDRAASEQQINRIATKLEPEWLGSSSTLNEGAPLIGPDRVVENGNGRVLGIRRAYEANGPAAERYRAWLKAQGYDIEGMKNPVLVRERTGEMTPAERVALAQEGTASTGMRMSPVEQAAMDADRLTPAILDALKPGAVDSAENADFVRRFLHEAVPDSEHSGFQTANGQLSVDGAQRLERALMMRAYGDRAMMEALAEAGDENIAALGGALKRAAPVMARLEAGIRAGEVDPSVDLRPAIKEAVRLVQQARSQRIPLRDAVAQMELGGVRPELTEALLAAAYGDNLGGRVSQGRLADLLTFYAEEARQQSTSGSLFGPNRKPAEIFQEARARGEQQRTAAGGGGNGAGAPTAREEGGGPGAGAAREGAGGEGGAEAPGQAGPIGEAPLQENMTPEAAAALKARDRAYRAYKDTFRRGAVGDVLQTGANIDGYRMLPSSVPGNLFGGKGGGEAMDALIRATGSPEAAANLLGDYPAFAFRRYAEVNGVIDPKKARTWLQQNKAALDKLPADVRVKFKDASAATEYAQRAAAEGQARIKEAQESALRHFLSRSGEEIDPQKAIGKLFASESSAADAKSLMRMMAGDEAARDGLRRNVVEHLLEKARSVSEAGVSGETEIASGQFQRFVGNPRNREVIRTILGPESAQVIDDVARDIQIANRAVNAVKIPGSPGTAADMAGVLKHLGTQGSMLTELLVGQVAAQAAGFLTGAGIVSAEAAAGGLAMARLARATEMRLLAGMATVNDLETQAVLNPALARALLRKVPKDAGPEFMDELAKRMAAIGVGGAVTAHGREKH